MSHFLSPQQRKRVVKRQRLEAFKDTLAALVIFSLIVFGAVWAHAWASAHLF